MSRSAANRAWLRLGVPAWTAQDWEDAKQDAAAEILKAIPEAARLYPADADKQAGYLYGAAKRGVIKGWLRATIARNPANTIPLDFADFIEVAEPAEPSGGLSDEAKRELESIFRAARKQQRGRAVAAAKRDVVICDLLVRGHRNEGIAVELGIAVDSVKTYRRHIKDALWLEAAKRGADADELLRARGPHKDFSYRVRGKSPRRAKTQAA